MSTKTGRPPVDSGHLHNHLVVNSVNCVDGKKLHQSAADLQAHRNVNDEICLKQGLSVLDKAERRSKKKRMKPGEYQAGLRSKSWKLDLIQAIDGALEYAFDREGFIMNMEQEGYDVIWMGELAYNAVELGRYLGQALDTQELPPIPTWSESKQRSREALKKLAPGQRFGDKNNGYDHSM